MQREAQITSYAKDKIIFSLELLGNSTVLMVKVTIVKVTVNLAGIHNLGFYHTVISTHLFTCVFH